MTSYLLLNATLIDGTGADPLTDAAILVDQGRISWVGAAAKAPQAASGEPA